MKIGRLTNLLLIALIAASVTAAVVVASRNRGHPIPLVIKSLANPPIYSWPTTRPVTPPTASTPAVDAVTSYPIDKDSGLLFLPVTWAGKPACFLVDTGSATNAVDPAVFGQLPNPRQRPVQSAVDGRLIGGTDTAFCDAPALRVGPFALQDGGRVALLKLSKLFEGRDPRVIGLLGMPSLGAMTLQLDFVHRQFRFLSPVPGQHADWGSPAPLTEMHEQMRAVSVRSAGEEWAAILDTGCGIDGSLQAVIFDRLTSEPEVRGSRMLLAFGLTDEVLRAKRLRSVCFPGDVGAFNNVTMNDNETGISLVGMSLFARAAMVTIDPVNHVMYVLRR